MKDVCRAKFVSRRFAFFTIIVTLVAVAVYAQTTTCYTRPFGIFNCTNQPGQSAHQIVSAPTVYPTGALITSVTLTGTKSSASTCINYVRWHVRHVASNTTCSGTFNANGTSFTCFNNLPADTQWEVWIECGNATCAATINNGQIKVCYR